MGDIAIALIEQGIDELILHETNQCDGMCSYCMEESETMGCYMNNFGEIFFGKADVLINNHNAILMEEPKFIDPDSGRVAVCVVKNYEFEAVGVAFSQQEFDVFMLFDERRKTWLSLDCFTVKRYAVCFDDYVKEGKAND